jgi:hypothetical protein
VELRSSLLAYDRKPFLDLLTEWVMAAPSPETIAGFADLHPDKYIQAMSFLARMGGYTDRRETSVDVSVNYRSLSDSQIEDRLRSLSERMGIPVERLLAQPSNATREEARSSPRYASGQTIDRSRSDLGQTIDGHLGGSESRQEQDHDRNIFPPQSGPAMPDHIDEEDDTIP